MDLDRKYKNYFRLIKDHQDKHGFVHSDECDSLLFSGLVGCTGLPVDIDAAQDFDHKWLRRPYDAEPCYDCNDSWVLKDRLMSMFKYWKENGFNKEALQKIFEAGGSTISRDMLLGLAWYAYSNKRLDISEGVIKYAISHWLIMGKGTPTRTFMTPGLLSTYAWISYRLGGPSRLLLRYIPQSESRGLTGFQAHLSVLHILLRNKLTGKRKYTNILDCHAKRQINNPLFQFAAGYVDAAKVLLGNENWWPEGRLPTAKDRYSDWLPQRDYGSDWEPSNGNKVYSGGDFLFVYWLINNY